MAKKEVLTRNGNPEPCVNVDAAVGPVKVARVQNLPGDVMLIQAIFLLWRAVYSPRISDSTQWMRFRNQLANMI
jgi:hypothetical protein